MVTETSLACWIIGLENSSVFLVRTLRSETVYDLKKAIRKEEPMLNHITADQLEIWKASDPARSIPNYS